MTTPFTTSTTADAGATKKIPPSELLPADDEVTPALDPDETSTAALLGPDKELPAEAALKDDVAPWLLPVEPAPVLELSPLVPRGAPLDDPLDDSGLGHP